MTVTRRRAGTWLMAAGIAVLVLYGAGHLGAAFAGTRLDDGEPYRWDGQPLYLNPLGSGATCTLVRDDGRQSRWVLDPAPSKRDRAFDLVKSNEYLTPGGTFAAAETDGGGELSCSGPVRAGSGWPVHGYVLAEGGLWTVIPSLVAVVVGRGLRRRAARTTT